MRRLSAAVFVLVVCAAPARADNIELNCDHPVAMMEQDLCASREAEAADAALNAAYAKVRRGLDAARRALLVDAQRAWVAFRDKQCNYVLVVSEGSGRNVAFAGCLTGLTKTRTRDLVEMASP
jgi:uncharacterized protein YecT (DUF1311 family)